MTYGQMYNLFATFLDKGGYPYLAEEGFDSLANNIICNIKK
jgi:hypothetical protein